MLFDSVVGLWCDQVATVFVMGTLAQVSLTNNPVGVECASRAPLASLCPVPSLDDGRRRRSFAKSKTNSRLRVPVQATPFQRPRKISLNTAE